MLFGTDKLLKIALYLPFNMASGLFKYLSGRATMAYSNVPSPTQNYNFGGVKCNNVTVFLPSSGDMMNGLIAVSHGQVIKLGFITDKHYIDDPQKFMALMHKYIYIFLGKN